MMAQDSDLKDFADAPGTLQLESDTDVDDAQDGGARAGDAGVLGMLSQFAKAQTDGRSGAAGI